MSGWLATTPSSDDFLKMIETAGGKGRFAQRLAGLELGAPEHLAAAIAYLVDK